MEQQRVKCICGKTVAARHKEVHNRTRYHISRSYQRDPFKSMDFIEEIKKKYNIPPFTQVFW